MSAVPRLSIGLPVYNGEGLLPEAIEALLGQSYKDFELIISDNASTDGTAEICRDYEAQDSRVRYVRQPSNVGVIANHNGLVAHARGEFFKWASHDDLYAGDYLQRCVDALDEHPEAVLAHAWWVLMDESCHPMKFFTHPETTAAPRAPGPVPQHAVQRAGRLVLRRLPDQRLAQDAAARLLPRRRPNPDGRAGTARPALPGPRLAVLPA